MNDFLGESGNPARNIGTKTLIVCQMIPGLTPMSSHSIPFSSLCQLPAGQTARVLRLIGDESFCQRIREMGFGEAALITKISGTETSLCLVNGMRIALNHGAAKSILVEYLPAGFR